ncbi:putative transcription factor Homeodomain-TALE-KNOX family [Helianthus annuus]|nr:putative transcription factor Homeodomain-TALE-KNOX family [Helianthus annuus]
MPSLPPPSSSSSLSSLSLSLSLMAFHDNISHEMALQHYTDQQQQLTSNVDVFMSSDHHSLGQSSSSPEAAGPKTSQSPPTWLNSAILRQHNHHHYPGGSFLHLQTTNSDSSNSNNHWLQSPRPNREQMFVSDDNNDMKLRQQSDGNNGNEGDWEFAKCKADILAHPMYDQLLSAHVSCLRIATPVDQLPRIDAQLAQSQQVIDKYSVFGNHSQPLDDKDLNQFMAHYVVLLSSFKEQLQQHVRVHAMEAVMACWELEQSLQSLTGVAPGEGTGATMSDDDEEQVDSDANMFDGGLDVSDSMGFGLPTESERSLMERVRQELKHELKQGYKEKIVDIREEILRKRRAGKLPGDTTSLLKAWWQSHSKWPYPTEEDKARLVQETGLQLKQINNWFINQRKRNWHSNPSSSTSAKSKRKSAR